MAGKPSRDSPGPVGSLVKIPSTPTYCHAFLRGFLPQNTSPEQVQQSEPESYAQAFLWVEGPTFILCAHASWEGWVDYVSIMITGINTLLTASRGAPNNGNIDYSSC